MGNTDTKLERELGPQTAENERYLGLENYGNTCYCNSVLQALYYCAAFRTALLHYVEQRHGAASGGGVDSLLIQLAQLYAQIGAHKRRTGVIGPRKFIQRLKTENGACGVCSYLEVNFNIIFSVIQRIQSTRCARISHLPSQCDFREYGA